MFPVYDRLEQARLVPVIRIEDAAKALPLARAVWEGGLSCVEITFRTPCAAQVIQIISKEFPGMLVGAGTVLTPAQAAEAVEAGAQFIVSPGLNPKTVRWCLGHEITVIPGCATPSDVESAMRLGLTVVKFFPAEASGGLGSLKAMSAPYPGVRFMPTGGICEENLLPYLENPKVLACGGSWMVNDGLIRTGSFEKITELCSRAAALVRSKERPAAKDPAVSFPVFAEDRPLQALGLGELLLRLSTEGTERISGSRRLLEYPGGAELNVMAGLSQLGLRAGILSKLAENSLGFFLRAEVRRTGVNDRFLLPDTSHGARTGLYFFERGCSPRKSSVLYDRKNSSFTHLAADDIPQEAFGSAQLFYTSGISLACLSQATQILKRFKEAGSLVAFDVNYRAALWGEEEARSAISAILPFVDILFISEESCRRMFRRTGRREDLLRYFAEEFGIPVVVSSYRTVQDSRTQSFGSLLYRAEDDAFFEEEPYRNIEITDRIGSGDAFVSGVLFGILERRNLKEAVSYGNAACAVKCTTAGDLPCYNRKELEAVTAEHAGLGIPCEMNR